jgi:hypothetical protein
VSGHHVTHGDGSASVTFPQVPKPNDGKTGGVIKHGSSFAIPISDSDDAVSGFDRADVPANSGPQSVAPAKAQDLGDGLPPEWFGAKQSKPVAHD